MIRTKAIGERVEYRSISEFCLGKMQVLGILLGICKRWLLQSTMRMLQIFMRRDFRFPAPSLRQRTTVRYRNRLPSSICTPLLPSTVCVTRRSPISEQSM